MKKLQFPFSSVWVLGTILCNAFKYSAMDEGAPQPEPFHIDESMKLSFANLVCGFLVRAAARIDIGLNNHLGAGGPSRVDRPDHRVIMAQEPVQGVQPALLLGQRVAPAFFPEPI